MQKEVVMIILCTFLILSCIPKQDITTEQYIGIQPPQKPVQEEKATEPLPPLSTEIQQKKVIMQEELKKESQEEPQNKPVTEESFKIFTPVLTYDGAYNGPLYGTSEQVGSASMDSYFKNLDRNGINFFIGMFGISGEPKANLLVSDSGLGEIIDGRK